jgi:hypothetical protein
MVEMGQGVWPTSVWACPDAAAIVHVVRIIGICADTADKGGRECTETG